MYSITIVIYYVVSIDYVGSCMFFSDSRLMARSRDSAENSIRFYLNEIGQQEITSGSRPANRQRALVVDGKTLTFLLDPR